jgi:hypothetical protein
MSNISFKARQAIQYVKLEALGVSEAAVRGNVGVVGKSSSGSRLEGVGVTNPRGGRNVKTDRLIEMLSANLERASRSQFGKTLILAVVAGRAAAVALMLATVGPRPDLQSPAHLEWLAVKLLLLWA